MWVYTTIYMEPTTPSNTLILNLLDTIVKSHETKFTSIGEVLNYVSGRLDEIMKIAGEPNRG